MNKKIAIISLLFITTSVTLFGCNSSTASIPTADNTSSTMLSVSESINSENKESNNIQPLNNTTSTQKETSNTQDIINEQNNSTIEKKDPITYVSKAGFSMTFPGSWEGKYTIDEDSNGLSVNFKSNNPEDEFYNSWMISINKSNTNDIPFYGLAVGNIQNFDSNGNHYIVFMPNDLTLDCRRADYYEYLNMMAECESVINSITITK